MKLTLISFFLTCVLLTSCTKSSNLTAPITPPCNPNNNSARTVDGFAPSMSSFQTSIDNNSNDYWVGGYNNNGVDMHILCKFNPVQDGVYETGNDNNGKGEINVTYLERSNTRSVSWQSLVGEKVYFQTTADGKRIITLCYHAIRDQSSGSLSHIDAKLTTPY